MTAEIYFIINLQESMGLGLDRTCDPWICSRSGYRLHYKVRYNYVNPYMYLAKTFCPENVAYILHHLHIFKCTSDYL